MISLILVFAFVMAFILWAYLTRRKDYRHSESVNSALYYQAHEGADSEWEPAQAWRRKGRSEMVAFFRMGRDLLFSEAEIDDLKWAYCIGYADRKAEEVKTIRNLRSEIKQRERWAEEISAELNRLRPLAEKTMEAQRTAAEAEQNYTSLYQSWQRQRAEIELERQKVEELENQQPEPPDYSRLTGAERNAAMLAMKDAGSTYRQIAEAFGTTEGAVKGAVNRAKAQQRDLPDNVLRLDFNAGSEKVREGV